MIRKVYKFGGASVKDAPAVRNLCDIVLAHKDEDILLVVSAMGKTTNMLEAALSAFRTSPALPGREALAPLAEYHGRIMDDLFGSDRTLPVYRHVHDWFEDLYGSLCRTDLDYDCQYDRTVSYGELISTTIVREYLRFRDIPARWVDARKHVITDARFRSANVDWEQTRLRIARLASEHRTGCVTVVQGFIGGTCDGGVPTTLGREGSDYTAAIFASCLDAEEVTIWKDVEGLLNADPKRFSGTVKIPHISYSEAIELAFYGASIIHPKTIKPLQNKGITLNVRSFLHPETPPTVIDAEDGDAAGEVPSYIVKDSQTLASFSPRDYSFMNEHNLQTLFSAFDRFHIHANMVQTSALMLSICFDHDEAALSALLASVGAQFSVKYNTGLQLFTIRHYSHPDPVEEGFLAGRDIIVKQSSRSTLQYVLK